jgi:hypothetical protein
VRSDLLAPNLTFGPVQVGRPSSPGDGQVLPSLHLSVTDLFDQAGEPD